MPSEPTDPLLRVLVVGGPAALALAAVAALVGYATRSGAGAAGALLGALLPAVFLGITALSGVWARRIRPDLLGFAILGSWLPKVLALMLFLHWLKHQTFYDRPSFFVTLVVGTFGLLMLEGWLVTRSPQLYVDRRPKPSLE